MNGPGVALLIILLSFFYGIICIFINYVVIILHINSIFYTVSRVQDDGVLSGGQRSATLQVIADAINSIPFRSNNS